MHAHDLRSQPFDEQCTPTALNQGYMFASLAPQSHAKIHNNLLQTEDELFDAIMTLKAGKCCGGDGLPVEFYKLFFKKIKTPLLRMYYFALKNQKLPLSTRRGLMTLLPKPNKNPKFLANKRPLTLLNTDYKVLAKALDNRLKTIIHKIVNVDQTGFVPGRNIAVNIRKLLDVMEYCHNSSTPAVILSIDMEKFFDRVEYHAIFNSLRLFNFGEGFISWVALFFNDFQVCTQNYGFQSEWWSKTRSVNQGCPISPTLYLLNGELMAWKLKTHPGIKGIRIGDTKLLISQFADDTDLYLPFDKTVLNNVIQVLSDIENSIGLKVSYDKTTLYRIGSIANTDAKVYTTKKIRWSNEAINTLGIDLHETQKLEKKL